MWHWIVQNKEWVFSGVGVTVVGALWWLVNKFWQKRETAVSTTQAPSTTIAPSIVMSPTINLPIEAPKPEPPKQVATPVSATPKPRPNLRIEDTRRGRSPRTERPVPNIVYAGGKRKRVFISPSQREGICDPRTEDERTKSVEAFVLKFENRIPGSDRRIGRALNVIAKMKFRHKNAARERDIDYGVWLNSPCNSADIGIGDTRELVLMCVIDDKLLTFEDRRTDNRFLDVEGFAYIEDGDVEDYDRVDITIIDQNSQATLHTKLKVRRDGASFFSSEL